jgi:hypothetical protein
MLELLKESLQEKDNQRFIFVTESCLPLYNLADSLKILFSIDKSWLNAFHRPKHRFEETFCFRAVKENIIPFEAVWKCIPGLFLFFIVCL